MRRFLLPVFFFMMIAAEALSFFFLLHANSGLQNNLAILKQAGHSLLPGPPVILSLDRILTAFYSSLFISLTAGLFLSLTVCLTILIFYLSPKKHIPYFHVHVCGIIILIVLAICMGNLYLDRSFFHRVRDHVLLSHPAGVAITRFYYAYSPYAVNALARPIQKPFKTCWIAPDVPEKFRFVPTLQKYGWYPVPNKEVTSFTITVQDHQVGLMYKNTALIQVESHRFFKNPDRFLRLYSHKTDSAGHLRLLCAAGLFSALPACFLILVYTAVISVFHRVLSIKPAAFITMIVLLSTAAGGISFLYPSPPDNIEDTYTMLASESLRQRVSALRKIYLDKAVDVFEPYILSRLNHMQTLERYWTAKTLAISHSDRSADMLRILLEDPSPFVAAAAVRSLNKRACEPITKQALLTLIRNNPWWYVQMPAIEQMGRCP
jgi:hypothetical protein